MAHVPIENISVSVEMELKVNKFRVKMIEESMRKRYDPSQSVLVVCPEVDGSNFDGDNVEKLKFFVIQKVLGYEQSMYVAFLGGLPTTSSGGLVHMTA